MRRKRFVWPVFLILSLFLTAMTPLFSSSAAENTDEAETEEYVEEIPEAYYWTIETNEIKKWPQGPLVEAEGAVVMDMDTGVFLYAKNMEAKMYPASITKIMTTLVAIENIDPANLDKKIKASEEALAPIGPDSSQIWLSPGEKITMRSALYAIMLASANDAANVVAEKVGGSIEQFVQMMNDKAAKLGCINTHFVNPHGLHDKDHYTCAHDMALIARAAYQNPLFRQITGTVEYKIPKTKYMKEDRWLLNHQKMMYEDDEYTYDGCVGGKTGFTDDAWNTLVTYAKREDKALVCVELRVNGSWKTFEESAALLDYGFQNFVHKEMDTELDNPSLGQLSGICHFGKLKELDTDRSGVKAIDGKAAVMVTIPERIKKGKLTKLFSGGNQIRYQYQGWDVGTETISFREPFVLQDEFQAPQAGPAETEKQKETEQETETETETETEKTLDEKVDDYMNRLTAATTNVWGTFEKWVNANEMTAAVVGFVLILLLIPLLIIAYIRDKNMKQIKKEREIEQEARKQLEESIENKSVQEIEAEIRAELERERLEKEREAQRREQRKRAAEEEERRIAEMEAVIDRQSKEVKKENDREVKDELGSADQG